MIGNLTFVVQFAYFCIGPGTGIRPSKGREQQKEFLFFFFEQLFEKLRETFWEISNSLWKALATVESLFLI